VITSNQRRGFFAAWGGVVSTASLMATSIVVSFGYAFYRSSDDALLTFVGCLFFVGVGGGSFAVYWTWISEQYRTECRGSALAFATSIGRFFAAGATFLVGAGIQRYGSIGVPVALTSIPFVLGLLLLPLAIETRGKPLPE
jgi:nitrate/nitrite transporter NarK